MAATFFIYANDSALLHSDARDHAERDAVIEQAEADVIRWFSRGTGSSRVIALEGYDEETPLNSETTLKQMIKETVAEIASHRLRYYDADPSHTLSVRGSRTFGRKAGSIDPLWPSGWERRLIDYETIARRY